MAASQRVLILTGGPGCGKTFTTRTIVALWKAMGKSIALASPTGRAAQRLSEMTGQEAKTVHRLLEFDPKTMKFKRDVDNPLPAQALVVDEASMLDLFLANSLLKAIALDAQLLLVGDTDQLPSVGPGAVLQDLIASEQIPVVRLTQVFRQAQASHIVRNGGLIPIPDRVSFEQASFVEPTNCCLKAVKKAAVAPGQTVLVTGAGPIGLMFIMLVKYFGARAIATDLLPSRIEKALSVGAEAAFDPRDPDFVSKIQALTGGLGVDTTLLAVPSDKAFFQALDCTRKGGKILFFAEFPDEVEIPINPNILYRREIDLMGSYSSSYRVQALAADIVFNGRIDVDALISDRYPLEDLSAAVEQAIAPTPETYKILLYPQTAE